MKRIVLVVACLALWASPAHAAESIPSFDTVVELKADSTLRITETVVYDMDTVQRHGLERIIPRQSDNGPRIIIRDVIATRDGQADPVSFTDSGDEYVIRIGHPDSTITGTHTYVLSYTVFNEVRYFDDRDEVYWNAIPQGMRMPINRATAAVLLPQDSTVVDAPACYTGQLGAQGADCVLNTDGNSVVATATRPLSAYEGMTVAVAVAPGAVTRVAPIQDSFSLSGWLPLVVGLGIFLVILAIIVGIIIAIARSGLPRKRSDGGDIVVQYDPPAQCGAPEAAYLAHPAKAGQIFTAGVVQLAVMGWLSMEFRHVKKFFGTQTEITFKKLKEGHPENPTLHQVLDALFIVGPERTLSELKKHAKSGAVPANAIAAGIPPVLERRGWYRRSGLFGMFTKLTAEGRGVKEHLAGLKVYLGAAEKERLEFHNAPEHSPQTFEKLLPYAIALGVDAPWMKAFGDLQYTPQWATGDASAFGMVALSESLHDLSGGISSVMNAYSSGTSGGGGGSSGGGGGGGGGGGW